MKNRYLVIGDEALIFINRKNGTELVMMIDAADIEKAMSVPGMICASWNKGSRSFYAYYHPTEKGKQRTVWFHRFLAETTEGAKVDHKNHNGLDNRRKNLRNVSTTINGLNRLGVGKRNTSGRRGVHFHKKSGKWRAQLGFQGQLIELGLHDTKEDAWQAFRDKLRELDHVSSENLAAS